MSKRKPYVRPMEGWWRKNPYFIEYMVHEGTALFVAGYALTLLCGLWRLSQGRSGLEQLHLRAAKRAGLLLHAAALAMIAYHSYTWFKIMPRTLPPLTLAGRRVSALPSPPAAWPPPWCSAALLMLVWG